MTVSPTEPRLTKATRSPLLAVAGLAVKFEVDGDTHTAVRDASFALHRGQVLALVGESGSGKSVTAMAALGLLPATARVSGSITLAGTELIGAEPSLLRDVRGGQIGTIFQEPMTALNPVFTIGDQVAEAIRAHRPVTHSAANARVLELLATVGLDDPARVARSYPHELSGGQLQRAMIAMAISCDPLLLIADEPTTALDVTVQAGILDLLRDLRTRLDMAVLLITHDMGVVADVADDVVVLRDGQIVEQALAAQLFAAPRHEYTRALLHAVPTLPELRLDEPEPATPPAHEPRPLDNAAATTPVVLLRNVVVDYPGRRRGRPVRAVDDVSLHIDQGELVALVGESGSGKSTLGRALAGLVPVTAGTVTVAGIEVGNASRRELRAFRSQLGIVFQDPASSLNPRRTVGASIAEPLSLHTDLRGDAQRRRVDELLDAVELPSRLRDRHPYEMSGGQRQRVAIARAIALNPALLIADEPTSALDVSVQARILELLRSLQSQFGFSCLFISHDLAVVEQLADRVAVLHRGRVVEEGPANDVLRAPRHPYTSRLLAAAPVADPAQQALRRAAWRQLTSASS
ncbi:peptide/nickel transport system ATP-binding protein [Micromonospora violae]|uniref:Peptide/nickel transport system ATP-binding protein n=1 Tax=Micromonospora violae TaxID=1278207 RepID=A0A4Q7UEZ9_9ACTN|nr:ABC transporter ATP-binding protein [Micromonospora violae]RZT79716.1 peptide/nickel transport system ATP-binding protein [Micromonospora violae]